METGSLLFPIYRIGRAIVRHPLGARLVPQSIRGRVQSQLSAAVFDRLPDRRYMEEVILPAIRAMRPGRLLDVGVRSYNQHYGELLPGWERWTIDVDPNAAAFGSPGRHVIGDISASATELGPEPFDVILMNGVFGYGVDRKSEQMAALEQARVLLRKGGWLLIGWDRAEDGSPLIASGAVAKPLAYIDPVDAVAKVGSFRHIGPSGLSPRQEIAGSSHVYDWFEAR